MTAPLVDVSDVVSQIGKVKDSDLPDLVLSVDAASQMLTDICMPLQPATVTDLLDGGQPSVLLSTYPVNAVTSVTTYDAVGTATAVVEAGGVTGLNDGWRCDKTAGVLYRVGWRAWPLGWGNVQAVYTVGPAVVPANVQEAAIVLADHLWQFRKANHQPPMPGNDPAGFSPSYAMPNKVLEMVRDYLKPPRAA